MAISYDEVAGTTDEVLFTLHLRATTNADLSEVLTMTDRITVAEAYPMTGGVANLGIDFGQGVLSYTLTIGDMTATRRMIVD